MSEKKKKTGRKVGGAVGGVAVIALIIALLQGNGLGFGAGLGFRAGTGDSSGTSSAITSEVTNESSSESSVEESSEETGMESEATEIKIVIVVKKDQYLVDDKEVTLDEIKAMVTEAENVTVVIENNYASVQAWDDLKSSLTEWGITPVEE